MYTVKAEIILDSKNMNCELKQLFVPNFHNRNLLLSIQYSVIVREI